VFLAEAFLDDGVFEKFCQAGDLGYVIHGLGGQAHHEVEAELADTGPAYLHRGLGQVVPGEAFVDDPAEAVAAGLRGQGDAAHPALGQELQKLGVNGVGPK
jgi:hypothetical protein